MGGLGQGQCHTASMRVDRVQTHFSGGPLVMREGSVLNPRFPAPVNTYNPTVHALVDAIFAAMSRIVPENARADGSGTAARREMP